MHLDLSVKRALAGVLREVLIIGLAAGIGSVILNFALHRGSQGSPQPIPQMRGPLVAIGAKPGIQGADAADRGKSMLLLVAREDCTYCLQSENFHRRLFAESESKHVPAYIAIPDKAKARSYLRRIGVGDSRSLRWDDLGFRVRGTPALLMISASGVVERMWIGRLDESREKAVSAAIGGDGRIAPLGVNRPMPPPDLEQAAASASPPSITEEELNALIKKSSLTLVDTRERNEYAVAHKAGSLNLPITELAVRAGYELDKTKLCVLDCANLSGSACETALGVLRRAGLRKLLVVDWDRSSQSCEFAAVRE